MGKRTPEPRERVPQDLYETPWVTVTALLPWLKPATRFVEPCCGRGLLAGWLKRAGHVLVEAYDLPTDARTARYETLDRGDAIAITNPPYWGVPDDLHALICNVSNQAPFWALLQHDWLANLGSGALAARARRIVPAGRARWFPGHSGMDNVAWVKFTRPSDEQTIFTFRDPRANVRPTLRGARAKTC
jgi:hypothetical protein